MRWPWRRRKQSGRVVFIGTSPFDVAQVLAAYPTPSPVVTAWVPDEPEPAAVPVAAAVEEAVEERAAEPEEPRAGVQLGFADGTVMTLDDDDPRAVALRAAAARLTSTG